MILHLYVGFASHCGSFVSLVVSCLFVVILCLFMLFFLFKIRLITGYGLSGSTQ